MMRGLDKETGDAHVFTGRDGQGWRQSLFSTASVMFSCGLWGASP